MLVARPLRRLALQRPPLRFNSSATSQAAKTAQETAAKAQEAASKAWTSASAQGAKALNAARDMSGGLGDRVGNMLGSYREPILYNLAVAREVAKQVYLAENLRPPSSLETITTAYKTAWSRLRDFNFWVDVLRSGYWAKLGVYALEAYGIFKIGEIIGRRKLVGYKLQQ
ncbi:hypothetical protein EXIGLDRAFT_744338 [Exidia glandulosa HHB12029]|uniref:Uncharacterized protein n=1 Tax=Exidia glandulosa HHB12029 TaxID=1314781 RepID=A0A165PY36_EXIGL|nr:hypothetical protein EXIGLDRAFT_744338 [Exidia glandulosa HHB12029]